MNQKFRNSEISLDTG